MGRTRWFLVVLILSCVAAQGCKERFRVTESEEFAVNVVELREGGVLTRYKVAPTAGAMLWLDQKETTGIYFPWPQFTEQWSEFIGLMDDGMPVKRRVLDWRWDEDLLRVNGAVMGARLPGAAVDDLAAAHVLYHDGCPADETLARIPAPSHFRIRILVVEGCAWTAAGFRDVAPRFSGLILRGGELPADAFDGLTVRDWSPLLLSIKGIPLDAAVLPALAPVAQGLKSLSLKDSGLPFVEGSVETLLGMDNLRHLDLTGTGVRDEDLRQLVRAGPRLDELRVGQTYLTAKGLEKLSRMGSLRALDLSNTRADAYTVSRFDDLPRLRRLDLRATAVEDPGAAELAKVPSLVELDAPFWLSDAAAPELAKLTGLRVLRARAVRFKEGGLKHLSALDSLLFLELNHVDIDDAGVAGLLPATSLEVLELEHTPMGNPGMEVLARMPRLRKIEIEETNVTDAGFEALAGAPALEVIKAQELPGITDAAMEHVATFPALTALVLDETEISDAAIPNLGKATGLRLLSLETTRVTDDGKDRLRAALPGARVK